MATLIQRSLILFLQVSQKRPMFKVCIIFFKVRHDHQMHSFNVKKKKNSEWRGSTQSNESSRKFDASKLVRHINGNTLDNRLENLALVTALEAFQNKGWTVDAVCTLTDAEFVIWSKARQFFKNKIYSSFRRQDSSRQSKTTSS